MGITRTTIIITTIETITLTRATATEISKVTLTMTYIDIKTTAT